MGWSSATGTGKLLLLELWNRDEKVAKRTSSIALVRNLEEMPRTYQHQLPAALVTNRMNKPLDGIRALRYFTVPDVQANIKVLFLHRWARRIQTRSLRNYRRFEAFFCHSEHQSLPLQPPLEYFRACIWTRFPQKALSSRFDKGRY